ncbi:hypothetical protein Scep_018167 [Stephania cephalantha]|uniref:Pentatricopeptide repeat-containing protein PNM1, mitochondrial n=1 Tax=Stephania cephalantha TaxID=152367 RepID=A0AAP0IQV4_9MAGN
MSGALQLRRLLSIQSRSHLFSASLRFLSSSSSSSTTPLQSSEEEDDIITIAKSISTELLKDPTDQSLPLHQRLDLHFSHSPISPPLLLHVLNHSPTASRTLLSFHQWISSRPTFTNTDLTISYLVDYFGRRNDFKTVHSLLLAHKPITGPKTLDSALDRLIRAGRAAQAVAFFDKMESDYGFARDKASLKLLVSKLCERGFAGAAEKMVKGLAGEFFPDGEICDLLVKGWCVGGKLDEARRLVREIYSGGFELGATAYNAILDCVCKLCREKDPFRLQSEAERVLLDMDFAGVARNVETFNVLVSNLCKIRRTEDALKVFDKMGEWGCVPDSTTYIVLIKSLYQAARVGEGDEMIDRMKSAGFQGALDKKMYYGFVKILCGIERIDHAMSVFEMMKKDGCAPGIMTYDLLMGKLCAHGRVEKANALYREGTKRGLALTPKVYKLDPRFTKPKVEKSKKAKRETLPEKMARKRTRLKKIRLSFVKKPKRMMRRSF